MPSARWQARRKYIQALEPSCEGGTYKNGVSWEKKLTDIPGWPPAQCLAVKGSSHSVQPSLLHPNVGLVLQMLRGRAGAAPTPPGEPSPKPLCFKVCSTAGWSCRSDGKSWRSVNVVSCAIQRVFCPGQGTPGAVVPVPVPPAALVKVPVLTQHRSQQVPVPGTAALLLLDPCSPCSLPCSGTPAQSSFQLLELLLLSFAARENSEPAALTNHRACSSQPSEAFQSSSFF